MTAADKTPPRRLLPAGRVEEIRARLGAITPWPWYTGMGGGDWYVLDNDVTIDSEGRIASLRRGHAAPANAALIANAPADLADLLAHVEALEGLLMDAARDDPRGLVSLGARMMRERAVAVLERMSAQERGEQRHCEQIRDQWNEYAHATAASVLDGMALAVAALPDHPEDATK